MRRRRVRHLVPPRWSRSRRIDVLLLRNHRIRFGHSAPGYVGDRHGRRTECSHQFLFGFLGILLAVPLVSGALVAVFVAPRLEVCSVDRHWVAQASMAVPLARRDLVHY
jgi:hypothetical protein